MGLFLSGKNINVKSDIFGFKFQSAISNLDKFLNKHESQFPQLKLKANKQKQIITNKT